MKAVFENKLNEEYDEDLRDIPIIMSKVYHIYNQSI